MSAAYAGFRRRFPASTDEGVGVPGVTQLRAVRNGGGMKAVIWVLIAGIALGQQGLWDSYMKEGDRLEQAGQYKEAKAAYQLALKAVGSPSDREFREGLAWNNLAFINRYLGYHQEAREQYHNALRLVEKARGPDSKEYAVSLHNLAALDYDEGRLDEAARQFRRALKIRQDVLGEDHPSTARTLNSLSAVYTGQGRYAEAERLCTRALAIQEKAPGPGQYEMSATLDNLASINLKQGRGETALELSLRADRIARQTYGDRHPLTCRRANRLAVYYENLGRFQEAQELLRKNLEIQIELLGEANPDVAATMANLAAVSCRRGMLEEADVLYRRAIPIFEHSGPNSPDFATVLWNYGGLLRQTGRKAEAKRLEARARTASVGRGNDRLVVDVSELLRVQKNRP
jgi:tetratricopeptide (TPR) repeat protein